MGRVMIGANCGQMTPCGLRVSMRTSSLHSLGGQEWGRILGPPSFQRRPGGLLELSVTSIQITKSHSFGAVLAQLVQGVGGHLTPISVDFKEVKGAASTWRQELNQGG